MNPMKKMGKAAVQAAKNSAETSIYSPCLLIYNQPKVPKALAKFAKSD